MRPPVLNHEDKLELGKSQIRLCCASVKNAMQKVLKILKTPNQFNDDRTGDKWLKLFLHLEITKRYTEIISMSRASVTECAIRNWFGELKLYLVNENAFGMMTDPTGIFNTD